MSDTIQVPPMDEHNATLVGNLHPPDWANPEPAEGYNLVVVGAGPAGLVVAAGAAGLGAKVALVEKHLMGGDCLNVGCVPSKCLIRCARAAAEVRRAGEFGVRVSGEVTVDFPAVMERMRKLRACLSDHDSAERFRELGVDIFFGEGRFTSNNTFEVDGKPLKFYRAVIATGARAVRPDVEGLEEVGFHTNETVFSMAELPRRLAVFGAGPIGCELAQAFARFGSEVTVIEQKGQLLSREDRDAVEILQRSFARDGVKILLNTKVCKVSRQGDDKIVHLDVGGEEQTLACDEILIGAGRQPNVEGLGLEEVGVEYAPYTGVSVDDTLRTTNSRIYAAGDVCLKHRFTHTADMAARIVIQNALFPGHRDYETSAIPWCTYTDPEVAHVGLYEHEAEDAGYDVDTYIQRFDEVDRAIADGEPEGLVKVHVVKGHDHILGATIVASHAGEMINELTLALSHDIGLGKLSNVIHPYPTQAEAIRKTADQYNRTRLKPFVRQLLDHLLAWER